MEIPCASLLQYPTQRIDHESNVREKAWEIAKGKIKKGREETIEKIINYPQFQEFLNDYFQNQPFIIPIPKHAPLPTGNYVWPAEIIANILVERGLGSGYFGLLERKYVVSRNSAGGRRLSTKEHHQSIGTQGQQAIRFTDEIMLVDDQITQGNTMAACCMRILENFPSIRVSAFSIFRTVNYKRVDQLIHPEFGTIRHNKQRDFTRTDWEDRP